ncbi:MAG: BrxA/BrxB family bacilliredoxin [Putridiphycobacter sp.]
MYPPELTAPMEQELVNAGYTPLKSADEVDAILNSGNDETVLVVINSVCGCAAGSLRPAVIKATEYTKTPSKMVTVFAGVDGEAVAQARKYTLPYPPSSPSVGLFKNGTLVHFLERHHIEGRTAEMIAENLTSAFDEYC